MTVTMPDLYREMDDAELERRVKAARQDLGRLLLILTHHYQRQEIVDLGDFGGDSFALSKKAAETTTARYIVFCGVHFMAESAAVLARDEQAVFIPEPRAGCPMADMAELDDVNRAWQELGQVVDLSRFTPVTYVNSTAGIKAFCGRNGGSTCTSSNADKVFQWALGRKGRIFFMPDEHLGRNTAAKLGIEPVAMWDPAQARGGLSEAEIEKARVIAWKGYCNVHTRFSLDQIKAMREKYPGCKVVVHPECRQEVVSAADASGSTEGIIKYTEEQPAGTVVVIGTEVNLIDRLSRRYQGEKTVVPLARSLCPNMFKINLHNLCWVVESLLAGRDKWINQVTVAADVKKDAAQALARMLEIA